MLRLGCMVHCQPGSLVDSAGFRVGDACSNLRIWPVFGLHACSRYGRAAGLADRYCLTVADALKRSSRSCMVSVLAPFHVRWKELSANTIHRSIDIQNLVVSDAYTTTTIERCR